MIPVLGLNPALISCSPVTPFTSLNNLVLGNCFSNTFLAFLSISTAAITFIPLRSNAKSKPPIPANNETALSVSIIKPPCS